MRGELVFQPQRGFDLPVPQPKLGQLGTPSEVLLVGCHGRPSVGSGVTALELLFSISRHKKQFLLEQKCPELRTAIGQLFRRKVFIFNNLR